MGTDHNLKKIYEDLSSGKIGNIPKIVKVPAKRISLSDLALEKYIVKYKKPEDSVFQEVIVDDGQFQKALKYLRVKDSHVDEAVSKIIALGLGKLAAEQIINLVMRFNNPQNFFSAILNPLSLNEFLRTTNIVDTLVAKYNIDRNLAIELLNYQIPTTPSTGKGEVLICLMVNNAKKSKSGDIEINNEIYEVKGTGARLQGQKGFGNPVSAMNTWREGLKKLIKRANIKQKIDFNLLNFGIGIRSLGAINDFAIALTSSGKISRSDIIKLYAEGFKQLYQLASYNELMSWINKGLYPNGLINNHFVKLYFWFALKYYTKETKLDKLVVIENSPKFVGKIVIATKEDIFSGEVLNKIDIDGYPSISPGSTTQSGFFKVKIRNEI